MAITLFPQILLEVWDHLLAHTRDKSSSISLIATENQLSPLARAALGSDLAQRYLLLDNTIWEYPQSTHLLRISQICEHLLKELYGVQFANIRPISGLNCMTVVLATLARAGDTVYTIDTWDGGHGATRIVAERLGAKVRHIPFDRARLDFDLNKAAKDFAVSPPDLIYIDLSNFLFPPSLADLKRLAPPTSKIYYDCSHILGLMLDPDYFSPFHEGLLVSGGSTHKTFPGPQRGVVLMQSSKIAEQLERTTDAWISNHHLGSLLALCITTIEMRHFGRDLSLQMRRNAIALGEQLLAEGILVETRGGEITQSHQVWLGASTLGMDPHSATSLLVEHNIAVNCARIPREPRGGKGLRFGTSEVSRLGFGEQEMKELARLIVDVLRKRRASEAIRADVYCLRRSFPTPSYSFSGIEPLLNALEDSKAP